MLGMADFQGYDTTEKFRSELAEAQSALKLRSNPLIPFPIGVGYLAWQLETPNSPTVELLSIALESRVQAVWFAFGENLGRWVQFVRERDAELADGHKTIVFTQISSVEEAKKAIDEWKVDVVVAQGFNIRLHPMLESPLTCHSQGIESGGHGHSSAPPLINLVSSIIAVTGEDAPPLLAAGGLANGAHVASFMVLGASGAVLGTRFLLTPESRYTDAQRYALLSATDSSTVRTMAFDRVRGTLGWPSGVDGRALFNATVKDVENGVSIAEVKEKYLEGTSKGDSDRMLVWAGTGVGSMSEIKGAKVRSMMSICSNESPCGTHSLLLTSPWSKNCIRIF